MMQNESVLKITSLLNLPRQVYYGWWVVAAVMVGLVFGYSTFAGVLFGLFVKPLTAEFGWSRTEISAAVTLSATLIVVLSPLLGGLVDRFGVRRILLPGLLAFGLAVAALALLNGPLWQLYLMYTILPIAGLTTLPTTYSRVILNWFDERRGLALGIGLCGVGLAAVVAPPAVQLVISNFGWRAAYLAVSLAILFIGWPIVYFVLKESPPRVRAEAGVGQRPARDGVGFTFAGCVRGKAFWLMVTAFSLLGVCSVGLATHLMALLTDRDFGAQQAAAMYAVMGAFTMVGRISCGYLVDRFFAPTVAAIFLSGPAIGLALLAFGNDYIIVLIAMCLIGLGFGAEFDLMSYLVSRYMGLLVYGKVYGIIYAVFALGAAAGPVVMGMVFDRFGDYQAGLLVFCGLMVGAVALLMMLGAYPVLPGRAKCGDRCIV